MALARGRLTVAGILRPPGDKSVTHRALMLAAVAAGTSEIRGALVAADTRATASVLRRLGARVDALRRAGTVRVTGARWTAPAKTLHCGNSGTTARLLLGLLAGHSFSTRLTGDGSLRRRPMDRVVEPLEAMGARFETDGGRLPLLVQGGRLTPLQYESPVASAQVKGAVLLAGLSAGVDVSVREPSRSRDHTERLLRYLGASVETSGLQVGFRGSAFPRSRVAAFELEVPGDISSAVFPLALGLLADAGEVTLEGVGLNPTRTGAVAVLRRMGADLAVSEVPREGAEPVGTVTARPSELRGSVIPAQEVPSLIDEIPMLAVLAARARGESRFAGVGELRVKESDRLALIVDNLRAVGADAAIEGDDLIVGGGFTGTPVGRVETAGDHRLAMAFGVLAALPGARIELSERASVAVSYPSFFADLERLSGG